MTGGEHEPQQIVADVVVERGIDGCSEVGRGDLVPEVEFVAQCLFPAAMQLALPQTIDRPVLRRRHEPRARIVRHAGGGPRFECGGKRILRDFFGHADVAHHARHTGNDLRRFDAPDCVDRPVGRGRRDRVELLHGPCVMRPRHATASAS